MGRVLPRLFAAIATLVVLPFAVNIETGGTPPDWLRPYVGWLWPVALACLALLIAVEIWNGRQPATISSRQPDARNRQLALDQVTRYVRGRRRGSLEERVQLTLDEQPTAVRQPTHLVRRVSGAEFALSDQLGVDGVFTQLSGSMLILGAPGAGKTTQLFDLAGLLVERARADAGSGLPVLLDLADWSRSAERGSGWFRRGEGGPRDFVEWLLAALDERYGIPERTGRAWLADDRLTLLLDGLDEVREQDRERCVDEINKLQSERGVTGITVCSRETDYAELDGSLRLQGAVVIRPLTREQVAGYLERVSPRLAGVADALSADEQLWELLTTPLMLNIMVLAQDNQTWRTLAASADPAERRRLLFDAYLVEVLARRRRLPEPESPERALRGLQALALASSMLGTGVRVVGLDEDTFDRGIDAPVDGVLRYWLVPLTAAMWMLVCVIWMSVQFSALAGLVSALPGGLLAYRLSGAEAVTVTRVLPLATYCLILSASVTGVLLGLSRLAGVLENPVVAAAVVISVPIALAGGYWIVEDSSLRSWNDGGWFIGPSVAVTTIVLLLGAAPTALGASAVGLAQGIGFTACVLCGPAYSAPGARHTPLVVYTIACIAASLIAATSWVTPFWLPMLGWAAGIACSFIPGVALYQVMISLFARVAIAVAGEPNPWRRSFLRFAVDRSPLMFTDGEYRFVHLLVRDHLVECDPVRLGAAVLSRRAELTPALPTGV